MKIRIATTLVLSLAILTIAYAQANVEGRWISEKDKEGFSYTMDFKSKGSDLTGTISVGGRSFDIEDGKIDNAAISFE